MSRCDRCGKEVAHSDFLHPRVESYYHEGMEHTTNRMIYVCSGCKAHLYYEEQAKRRREQIVETVVIAVFVAVAILGYFLGSLNK